MKFFISGGNGYLGSALAYKLHGDGHDVTVSVRNEVYRNLFPKEVTVLKYDFHNFEDLQTRIQDFDGLIHAAGMSAFACELSPLDANLINGEMTGKLMEISANAHVPKFIHLSTIHVYPQPWIGSINENSNTLASNAYSASKLLGENLVHDQNSKTRTIGISLRLSNVFGSPRIDHPNFWSSYANEVCLQAFLKNKIEIKSDPSIRRDFLPMETFLSRINSIITDRDLGTDGKVLNIVSGLNFSLFEFACLVQIASEKILGRTPKIIHNKSISDEISSNFQFRSLTKFEELTPKTIGDEIERTFKHLAGRHKGF